MTKIMIEISDDDYESIKRGMRYKDTIADIMQQIEDAEPVLSSSEKPKMGRWNKSMDDYSYFYTCSCCGERIAKNSFGDDLFSPYCPECGANMQEMEG